MEKPEVEVARLSAQLAAGFGAMEHRLDDLRGQMTRVEAHVIEVERQARMTNGRVNKLEARNEARDEMAAESVVAEHKAQSGEASGITRRDVTMVLAGGTALVAAWRFAEWAFGVLRQIP